jgi:hypothetical protein
MKKIVRKTLRQGKSFFRIFEIDKKKIGAIFFLSISKIR